MSMLGNGDLPTMWTKRTGEPAPCYACQDDIIVGDRYYFIRAIEDGNLVMVHDRCEETDEHPQ